MSPKTSNSASVLKCNVLCYAPLTTGYWCRPSCPGVKVINLLNDKWLYVYMYIHRAFIPKSKLTFTTKGGSEL